MCRFPMDSYYSITNIGLVVALALFTARILLQLLGLRRSHHVLVKHIAGPSPSSWVYGSMRELMLPSEYGQHEYGWQEKYGPVYRIKGCFGEDRLMISDPQTIRHILMDTSTFHRSPQQQQVVRMTVGENSVFHVIGNDHRRLRGVMNPAFSAGNVRALQPVIQRTSTKMADQWKESLSESEGAVINVSPFLQRATLDVIGEAILGVPFNTLENNDSELARTHLNLLELTSARSNASVLFEGIMNYLPVTVFKLALLLPTTALRHLRRNRELTSKIATDLIEAKEEAFRTGLDPEKDLMTLLVNANATNNSSKKMSVIEMRDQVATMMLAGQESLSTAMSWVLFELAKNPAMQATLRAEISETRAMAHSRGDNELSCADLDGMPYLNACIKETLRLYAAVPMSERVATEDAILPLSQSIVATTGERITELPVKRGQPLIVATWAYQRATSIWGEDAKEFRPSRWMQGEYMKGDSLGPYASLLSFLGGPRTCIGWRLAVIEIQVVITELIRKFSFAMPAGPPPKATLAVTLIPVMDGGEQGMPLHVKLLE